jgi:hypothetical protein
MGRTMLVMYRGYTLVLDRENGRSQVKIFSRANALMGTKASTSDETALAEARQTVDAFLSARRTLKSIPPAPPAGGSPAPQAQL